jgi:hypothetical protein
MSVRFLKVIEGNSEENDQRVKSILPYAGRPKLPSVRAKTQACDGIHGSLSRLRYVRFTNEMNDLAKRGHQ